MKNIPTFDDFVKNVYESKKQRLNEIADWDTYLTQRDKETVSCDDNEMYERDPIRDAVKKTHPGVFTDMQIDIAIEMCCNKKGQSRTRKDFEECVYDNLFELLGKI